MLLEICETNNVVITVNSEMFTLLKKENFLETYCEKKWDEI